MEKLLQTIKETSGTNKKKQLLVKANDNLKKMFYLTYNPIILSNIKKIPKPKVFGSRNIDEAINDFEKLFRKLNDRIITGKNATQTVERFMETVSEESYEWFTKSLKKDLKIGVSSTLLNTVFHSRFIPEFNIQLAEKYVKFIKTKKGKETKGFYLSPKLDGLRSVLIRRNMFDTIQDKGDKQFPLDFYKGDGLYTRQGKKVVGFEHIEEEGLKLMNEFNIDLIDGEMYSHTISFGEIQSAVVSYKDIDMEKKKQIFLNVFAVINDDVKNTADMVSLYTQMCEKATHNFRAVEQYYVENDFDKLKEINGKMIEKGYEGIMLRHVDAFYTYKRNYDLMKYKHFEEEDFTIFDFEYGKEGTKYEGQLNVLWVEGVVGDKIVKSKVQGMSDKMKAELHERMEQGILKDTIIEVKYQELSKAENNDNYAIRFGTVNKLKLDR